MAKNSITKSMLKPGMNVEISLRRKGDRSAIGEIEEILTNTNSHPHGILVRLVGGEEGRVTSIIDEQPSQGKEAENHLGRSPQYLDVDEMLLRGEGPRVEFKESLLWSSRLSQEDIQKGGGDLKRYGISTSRILVARALAGFLNSRGGQLLLGIREHKSQQQGEVVGIDVDYHDIKDKCDDGYRRAIVDRVIAPYFPSFVLNDTVKFFDISFPSKSQSTLCLINVRPSDRKVYLRIAKEEHFYIRVEASTRELRGEEVVDYCMVRFGGVR